MNNGTLQLVQGRADRPIKQLVLDLASKSPALVWCEPLPTRARIEGFVGLWQAPQDRFQVALEHPMVEIEEARLFWSDGGAVHLVRRRTVTAWVAYWPLAGAAVPEWRAPLGAHAESRTGEFTIRRGKVLTQQDWNRYGLEKASLGLRLRLVEYLEGTDVVFWHLQPDGEAKS